MYLRCFKLYLSYFISFSSSQDCIEVQEKKKKVAVLCFRPPQKKNVYSRALSASLHVSTSYEFLSFSEPISQDFYPQPTSIDKQSVSSVKLTRNQTRVRSTTHCQLFFFTRLNWLSTYRDSRLPLVCLSYVCHVFALVSGNPLARQAHSLLWFWSLLLISARADVNELLACFDFSTGETWSATVVSWVCLYSRWFCTAVAVCFRTSSDGLVRFLLFLPRSKLGNLVL